MWVSGRVFLGGVGLSFHGEDSANAATTNVAWDDVVSITSAPPSQKGISSFLWNLNANMDSFSHQVTMDLRQNENWAFVP